MSQYNKLNTWLEQLQAGSRRALARVITAVENDPTAAEIAINTLYPRTGHAHIIGITGAPGAGKSSLVTELAKELRRRDLTIGIIAVDPSSPFTGGALLGDRVRMGALAGDKGVFIRSMASRGRLGGLSQSTTAVLKVMDAAHFDLLIVETVGAGQAEVDIASAAHTTIVVEAPGMGDDVQAIKAGILEIADILVVNKADRPGARQKVKSLEMMLHLGPLGGTRHHGKIVDAPEQVEARSADAWQIPVIETIAIQEKGLGDLAEAIWQHRAHLHQTGQWIEREKGRAEQEAIQLVQAILLSRLQNDVPAEKREALYTAVAKREISLYTAVQQLLS